MFSDTPSEEEDDNDDLYNFGREPANPSQGAAVAEDEGLGDVGEVQVGDYATAYSGLAADVLGDEPSETAETSRPQKGGKRRSSLGDGDAASKLFDWRRGPTTWPEGVELIGPREAQALIDAARAEAEKAAEKEKDDDVGYDLSRDDDVNDLKDFFDEPTYAGPANRPPGGESFALDDDADDDDDGAHRPSTTARKKARSAPSGAKYRRLKDGSWALEVAPGARLKLDLASLVSPTGARDDEARRTGDPGRRGYSTSYATTSYYRVAPPRELLNEYTVTLDVKLDDEPPPGGLSLFQTALVHSEESRGGRRRARESDGEALVNAAGGVGVLGTYGDVAKCRVEVGVWERVVVAVKCASQGARVKKGELRTYVGAEPAAVVRHERIAANERFALRSDGLFLFSSRSDRMMPGNILVRTCRVDAKALDDAAVRRNRARDKLFSTFEADNARKVDDLRKGLSLAKLFAKPRPCWEAPALVGAFGDAYVEGTTLEAASILAWSHAVLDLALRAALKDQRVFLAGMPLQAKAAASDASHVIARSAPLMKGIVRLLRNPGAPQLASWLRALKKRLEDLDMGESILLPLIVENSELLAIVERLTERNFTFVVIATNPTKALRHHAVSAETPPKIKFRTALVMTNVAKKNALDDVFWAAVYNLAIHHHEGDTKRFYELLLPFLTGKPLETSLYEADRFDAEARQAFFSSSSSEDLDWDAGDDEAAFDRRAAAASKCGAWRSPQRSLTAYVRCISEALHYLMLRRGCTDLHSKQVRLALRAQLATFCARDVAAVAPDENGRRVVALVAKQLSYTTEKLAERAKRRRGGLQQEAAAAAAAKGKDEEARFDEVAPEAARRLAERLLSELDDVPPSRDAAAAGALDLASTIPTQWRDALAWRVDPSEPDPGQAVLLRKYVAIDTLQVPVVAKTRTEAIAALRHCDRICSLLDNQPHAVKNDKLLIIALVQHTLTCVIPTPRPRARRHVSVADEARAGRAERRRERVARKKKRAAEVLKASRSASKAMPAKRRAGVAEEKVRATTGETSPQIVEDDGTNWDVGTDAEARLSSAPCIWDEPIEYAEQVEVMLTLRRVIEHFTAAVLSTQQDRALDAVCVVIPGVACAIADAMLRRRATDHPSPFTAQLGGQTASGRQLGLRGYGLSAGTFATQTTSIECHVPELAVARAAVLDYFSSPEQRGLEKIFAFEDRFELRPGKPLIALLRSLCREITLATPNPHLELCDALPCTSNLLKNFPELGPYRDLAFFWKFFLNPDRTSFSNYVPAAAGDGAPSPLRASRTALDGHNHYRHYEARGRASRAALRRVDRGSGQVGRLDCLQAQLTWGWSADEGGFSVSMGGKQLRCRPDPDVVDEVTGRKLPPERAPQHRFPSRADPASYLATPPPAQTEDDILYRPQLPGFSRAVTAVPSVTVTTAATGHRDPKASASPHATRRRPEVPALGQRDAELLLSYLTVPYLRIPLVLTFFASDDRVHKLESPMLRGVLDAVLFEPGRHLALGSTDVEPATVPTPHPSLLATANGHLLAELREAPSNVINNVVTLLRGALALDTGAVCDADATDFNASVQIILYTARLGARLESFVAFARAAARGRADCANANSTAIGGVPLRDLDVRDPAAIAAIDDGASRLAAVLARVSTLFDDYLAKLDAQTRASPGDETLVDRNSRLACDLHAHRLLIHRNALAQGSDDGRRAACASLLGSFLFLTTRHTFNKATREEGRLVLPEFELYELLQHVSRGLVSQIHAMTQYELDMVMQAALAAATSCTGAVVSESSSSSSDSPPSAFSSLGGILAGGALEPQVNRWSRIKGDRNRARYTVASTRTLASGAAAAAREAVGPRSRSGSMSAIVGEVADSAELDVEIDIGIGQLTLRSKHLAALDPIVATNRDVRSVLGDATLQASLAERSVHRQIFRLVGLEHTVEWWHSAHAECVPMPENYDREYDPAELFDSELWLPRVFEPVRRAFFDGPVPPSMQFVMHDGALPADAEVAVLFGLHQRLGGPSKRIVAFRRRRCVHVYELVSRGREWWWSLHLTTDARFCLAELQPVVTRRATPFPQWWKHGAGLPYPVGVLEHLPADLDTGQGESVVVRRDASHPANLSGGVETYIPPRLLAGLVPEALLDVFRFWRDESRLAAPPDTRLRGYPLREDAVPSGGTRTSNNDDEDDLGGGKDDIIVFVEMASTGIAPLACTGRQERTVRVSRRSLAGEKRRFHDLQRLVAAVERLGLVAADDDAEDEERTPPSGIKRSATNKGSARKKQAMARKKEAEIEFREGADVEFRSRATESDDDKWIPCEVVKVDYEKRTYDLEFSNAFSYLGVQRAVPPEDVAPRGANDAAKAEGEGKWKFSGLTDSEDEAWRDDEDEDDDEDDEEDLLDGKPPGTTTSAGVSEAKSSVADEPLSIRPPTRSLSYAQRCVIGEFFEASGHNVELCEAAFDAVARDSTLVKPLATVFDLASEAMRRQRHPNPQKKKEDDDDDDGTLYLLDLLHARRGSRLYSLASTLVRIENLAHILAWTKEAVGQHEAMPCGCPELTLVELPRLKLSFTTRLDHYGQVRLFSVDHVDLFVLPDQRNDVAAALVRDIEHSLLLANARGDTFCCVPVIIPKRPPVRSQPFSTDLVLDRQGTYEGVYDAVDAVSLSTRFFLYNVHVSMAFVLPRGLASALYLLLLRLLKRDYAAASRLCDSVASDVTLSADELAIFRALREANDDRHPNAHAVRLRVALVTAQSGHAAPWDLSLEMARYVAKIDHVSAECRLPATDELRLLESEAIALDEDSPAYDPRAGHTAYALATCKNRRNTLRAALRGDVEAECVVPPRDVATESWTLYTDETCFGMTYAEVHPAHTIAEYEAACKCRDPDASAPADLRSTTPRPPGGWLVCTAYTASWSSSCQTLQQSIAALAPTYASAIFVEVKVDADPALHDLAVSRGVEAFPTFTLDRGDDHLALVATNDKDEGRSLATLIKHLEQHVSSHDHHAYSAWRRRERVLERGGGTEALAALAARHDDDDDDRDDDDDEDDDDENLWTWDPEASAEGLRIEGLGKVVALPLTDDFDEERPVWESSRDDGRPEWRTKWEPFPPAIQTFLEIAYLSGKLYREMSVTDDSEVGGLHVYFSEEDLDIDSYGISGLKGYMTSDYEDIRIRRRGPRVKVPGEEGFLSKRQEAIDRRNDEWKQQYYSYLARQREARRGRDAVAARGTAPLQRDSGTHRWSLRWGHAPGSRGAADGVGIIAEGSEALGPTVHPCLGGPDCDGGSLGLHANGELWVAGHKVRAATDEPLWGEGARITVVLDTSASTIVFILDDDPAPVATVDRIFERLGCTECYPAVAVCPLDAQPTDAARDPLQAIVATNAAAEEPATTTPGGGGGGGDSSEGKGDADAAEAASGDKSAAAVAAAVASPKDDGNDQGDEEAEPEDEGDVLASIMAAEPQEQLAILELAQLTRVSPEKIVKMNAKQRQELEKIAKPPICSVAIVDDVPSTQRTASTDRGGAPEMAAAAAAPPPSTPPSKESRTKGPPRHVKSAAAAAATTKVKAAEEGGGDDEAEEDDDDDKAAAAATAADDVPIEKIRWMRETPNGWIAHDAKVSAALETAKRAGRLEVSLVVDGAPFTFKLAPSADGSSEEPMQIPDGGGEATKLRRHFVGEGLRGSWEMLSLRYAPPASLYGVATLTLLEKVWANGETFRGERHGYGFLLLYALFQGDLRAHICGSSWTNCGLWGWGSGGFGAAAKFSKKKQRTANDSHRLALLLTQLYSDRRVKSVWASLVNVLGRNRQLCVRLPKFRDTRRKRRGNCYNGWVDESEPKSPLAELFEQVVPVMQRLRRKRGAILFPPKPPHQALPAPPSTCRIPDANPARYLDGGVPGVELSDSARREFEIGPVEAPKMLELAEQIGHPLALRDDDLAHAAACAPADIYDAQHWRAWVDAEVRRAEKRQHDKLLVVACFDAAWCPASRSVEPALRALALSTPTARFARLDVDDCDDVADAMGVTSTPALRFVRGRADNVVGSLDSALSSSNGGGADDASSASAARSRANDDFAKRAVEALFEASTPAERATLADTFSRAFKTAADAPNGGGDATTSGLDQLRALRDAAKRTLTSAEKAAARSACRRLAVADAELKDLGAFPTHAIADKFVVSTVAGDTAASEVPRRFPFDVVSRHDAAKTPVAQAMLARMRDDAKAHADAKRAARVPGIRDCTDVEKFYAADATEADAALDAALATVVELETELRRAREADADAVALAVPLVTAAANAVDDDDDRDSSAFVLRRLAGRVPEVWPEFAFSALISSAGAADLRRLNPFAPADRTALTLRLVAVTMLRANRVGTLSRCAGDAVELRSALEALRALGADERRASEAVTAPHIRQFASLLAAQLAAPRAYARATDCVTLDPRFLIFEFVKNIAVREEQVHVVSKLVADAEAGVSRVKQMIMGAGKTTVVAPLLALMLADGHRLVACVVPKALLEMTRAQMRSTFSTIISKRVYTLHLDRSSVVSPQLELSLRAARDARAVVVATPTTIKSLMLSYIEALQRARDDTASGWGPSGRLLHDSALAAPRAPSTRPSDAAAAAGSSLLESQHETPEGQARVLRGILALFREGAMLVDEVDLILHPLKSELNFPCGEKFALDGAEHGERWLLPIALVDAVFYASTRRSSVLEARGATLDTLERLADAIDAGYDRMALQRLPHLTLLDSAYYHEHLKPLLAEIAWAWLTSQHLHGVDKDDVVSYLLGGVTSRSAVAVECRLVKAELDKRRVAGDAAAVAALVEAHASAEAQRRLISDIFEIEGEIEDSAAVAAEATAKVDARLAAARRRVAELECPPDASLDNSVVVWLSSAFGAGAAGAGGALTQTASDDAGSLDASMSVASMCTRLEESLGVTVRRCDEAIEAVGRSRELAAAGRLRCVLAGGGEQRPVCGPTCTRNHFKDGPCVRCGREWGSHNGHMCQSGGRGAWPLAGRGGRINSDDDGDSDARGRALGVDSKIDLDAFLGDLVAASASTKGIKADAAERQDKVVPVAADPKIDPSRVCVYVGHAATSEKQRLALWRRGVVAVDTADTLVSWVQSRPQWPSKKSARAGSLDDDDDDDLNDDLGGGGDDESAAVTTGKKPRSSAEVAAARLESVRARVEALEHERSRLLDADEQRRRELRSRAATVHAEMEAVIKSRLGALAIEVPTNGASEDELDDYAVGSSRDAALALALAFAKEDDGPLSAVEARAVRAQERFLRKLALAAKVMAKVSSPSHKKLLNLARDWLKTYLPHCLAKVNRVSFGLLDERDIERALAYDPRMPRSRLKLAVPFVGKDVPSSASEFAHPDVTIGMTCLAYRYSGLRREDFDELADALTADFAREIGPACDRPSSRRHEAWVRASGGRIRGLDDLARSAAGVETRPENKKSGSAATITKADDDRTVVQLKFLQKSNEEQMDKLFELWRREPLALHHYLETAVFPTHMRSQRRKISASGQAIGGDMLFARRVGFSGTPSDLLPLELGACEYQEGDDGKMLATVLDRDVCSSEELPAGWSVEDLLELAATATAPRIHALIDTGALVTGRTNRQVATDLLKRGLAWCDGVVYLDDDDKKQVLVRATMRAMPEEQCGVPLERRFAFYDQVHTTGIDVRHVANAMALVTLGKDMVWRDFAQGVFRMRGIGTGQRVRVVVIPEVRRLVAHELGSCRALEPSATDNNGGGGGILSLTTARNNGGPHISPLAEIVAWLVVNSLRAEQLQWSMLCAQNISNVYRKEAFFHLATGEPEEELRRPVAFANASGVTGRALRVFEEPIDFSLEAAVPDPVPFEERLRTLLEEHAEFAAKPEQQATATKVLAEVGRYVLADSRSGAKRLDTEQEREQEQEQQKEVRARKDQQIEVEKFVEREYSRNEEAPKPWPLSMLAQLPPEPGQLGDRDDGPHAFYPLADFALRHHEPLAFPRQLLLSRNYFRRSWMGLRRLKNVVVLLEWAPLGKHDALREARDDDLSSTQRASLAKAHALFSAGGAALSREALRNAVDVVEDVGRLRTDDELEALARAFAGPDGAIDVEGFTALVSCGALQPEHENRYWVAVSLAEAETLRRALHVRRDRALATPAGRADPPEIALRYSPLATHASTTDAGASEAVRHQKSQARGAGDGGVVLDASRAWWSAAASTGATASEAALAHNAFRFFDGDVHFSEPALHALVRALRKAPPRRRERYFAANVGARRRLERAPRRAPLGRAFAIDDEYALVARRATAVFMRAAIEKRGLSWWAAFAAFDDANTGSLLPAEVYGALRYLGAGDFIDAEDVLDFMALAANPEARLVDAGSGSPPETPDLPRSLTFAEFVDALRVDADDDDDDGIRGDHQASLKVEPYGADEIRDAMLRRRRAAIEDAAAERARAEARAEVLDRQLYDEELAEAERKHGDHGLNPRVLERPDAVETTFSFGAERKPLRCRATDAFGGDSRATATTTLPGRLKPTCAFAPLDLDRVSRRPVPPLDCVCGSPLKPFECSWERCSRCKPRDARGCTRICWSCYSRVCERCVLAHDRAVLADRADPANKPTYLRCDPGTGLLLQLPAKTFSREKKNIARPALAAYSLTLEIKLDRPPPRDSVSALVRVSHATTPRPATLYVDSDGRLLAADGRAHHGARLLFKRWCVVTLVVDALDNNTLDAYVHGKPALSLAGLDDLKLGRDLALFCGDKLAHARG
ncbi:hypothetical protein CTAYLR_001253 [Chrysophaeum taylorii]|uniref:ubiquitinyl hydrolase 1 n=1 Tax=Chrysophaeum taylorii TaxID=2483200 RepID=A0AAD7UEH9_9STRA|nr:hypothetical protein CTAYLR_001253 [Chrysophaeum taylorii]